MNSYAKFGGAARRRFSAICEKPMGGGTYVPPPAVRGLIKHIRMFFSKEVGLGQPPSQISLEESLDPQVKILFTRHQSFRLVMSDSSFFSKL